MLRFLYGERNVQGQQIFTGKNGRGISVDKLGFKNAKPVTSFRVDFPITIGTSTGSALTVTNSTGARSTKLLDVIRKAEFANTLYEDDFTVSKIFDLFKNDRNVTPDYLKARMKTMAEGFWTWVEGMIQSVTPGALPSESVIGSFDSLLSDGLTAANRATYWTALGYADSATGTPDETNSKQYVVDRSATGNETMRALIRRPGATATAAQIRTYVRQLRDNGAVDPVVWLNPTAFDALSTEIGTPANSGIRNEFIASKVFEYGLQDYIVVNNNTLVTYDKSIPSNRGYILTPSTWVPTFSVLDTDTFDAPSLRYGKQSLFVTGQGLFTDSPRQNMKLYRF